MSSPLCLDLGKYGATEHSCGCLIACPFAEVKASLGLHAMSSGSKGEGARGTGHYTVGGQKYTVDVVAHTRSKHPGKCCFHIGYEAAEDDIGESAVSSGVSIATLSAGLSGLFGPCQTDERTSLSYVELTGAAPVLAEFSIPVDWPDGVKVSGANLVEPSGKASAIVQARSNNVLIAVSVGGGNGLSPKQIRSGFLTTIRLAEAFRDGNWRVTEREVQAYGRL